MSTEEMNVIRVTEGESVWWHVTKGNMASEFETVADYIPDEATAHRIAASEELLEALDYLLQQTIYQDLQYGIALTEGERDAQYRALTAIGKARGA